MSRRNDIISKELYPKVAAMIKINSNKVKKVIGDRIEKFHNELFDTVPCSRIFFGQDDIDAFFNALGLTEKEVYEILENCFYFDIPQYNPRAAKDPLTQSCLCMIRYALLNNKPKDLELYTIYLGFSGRLYPSIHSGVFKIAPVQYRNIMEAAINNLSNRFEFKVQGNVFNTVKSTGTTWYTTYKEKFKDFDDDDCSYLIEQYHMRIKSFLKNIGSQFYQAYERKDAILYSSDNLNSDNYHIANNDSVQMERYAETAMTSLGTKVNYKFCRFKANSDITANELAEIVQSILDDKEELPTIKELLRLIISEFYDNEKNKGVPITNIKFVTYSIKPKPNSKKPTILRQKEIIETWLDENSSRYRKRKSRDATRSSYQKALMAYFVLVIFYSNK